MKYIELQYAFELEAANIDKYLTDKLSSQDILYWLNNGVDKFVKTRYNGNNFSRTSFEQDEKRTRDLMSLYKSQQLTLTKTSKTNYDVYAASFPDDLMFVLDENVMINTACNKNEVISTDVFECTSDNYMQRIRNSLTDFHFRNGYARPLRINVNNGVQLFTDKLYDISEYNIGYLRKPSKITMDKPFDDYTEFPDYVHNEIVKLAVQMYIENSSNQRYNTIVNEVNTME